MPYTIVFQGPMDLTGYDRSRPESQQPPSIPIPFLDAMKVRESVFVEEQGVPLTMEADSDDARCCHWIAYANEEPATVVGVKRRPVGTVRLVPFPHDPHPPPGSSWDIPEDIETGNTLVASKPPYIVDRATSAHDGTEAYLKFGRWAVIKEARGQGIAVALIEAATKWLQNHARYFDESVDATSEHQTRWNGLMIVHAQKYVMRGWQKMGFAVDEDMGEWTEAGIPHVGLWKRLDLGG